MTRQHPSISSDHKNYGDTRHPSDQTAPIRCSSKSNRPKIIDKCDLGLAWAGNTVNTVIFRHHGIFSQGNLQYTAFYVDFCTIQLVQRDLISKNLQTYNIFGEYNLGDAHNSISLGIDRRGYLHLCYDHHATHLRYRRSIHPHSINGWTDEMAMTGIYENQVTYPTFILPQNGFPLTLLYRDGVHNKGTARIKTYDEDKETWIDHPLPILSGADHKPWTSNAYWNHPARGSDGTLHLSFVWRTDPLGQEERINNINIGYAYSQDNGLSWSTSHGRPYRLPITQVNAEIIHAVSPGSNLINQCSMALDSRNFPHIVFYSDDLDDIPQYQHVWFDGRAWRHQFISKRTNTFSLLGGGTLQLPISRPDIIIDENNNVFIITRSDHTNNKMAITKLKYPDYDYSPENTAPLMNQDLGFSEPVIDRSHWIKDKILSMLIQWNKQPNHDTDPEQVWSQIKIVDIHL